MVSINLDDFDFESDPESGVTPESVKPKSDNFLKAVVDSLNKDDAVQGERYQHIKNQILDVVKTRMTRQRTLSTSSIGSHRSLKRGNPDELSGKSPIRAKNQIPLPKK